MDKAVIVHGTMSSPESNWFPWLSSELSKRKREVLVPRMPTPNGQSLDGWLSSFRAQVQAIDNSTILIGHSLGATFILRLLERGSQCVQGVVLVAGFASPLGLPEYDTLNSTFTEGAYNWSNIRENAGVVTCICGENDPYVPRSHSTALADNLGVRLVIVPAGGHLNAEAGFTEFPLILDKIVTSKSAD